jgi:ribonucleoside-diphosphate reductase alpha chain
MQETKKDLNKKTGTPNDKAASYYKNLLNKREADINEHVSDVQKTNSQKLDSFKWLTEHSRSFLAAGYVPEGIIPETRII